MKHHVLIPGHVCISRAEDASTSSLAMEAAGALSKAWMQRKTSENHD